MRQLQCVNPNVCLLSVRTKHCMWTVLLAVSFEGFQRAAGDRKEFFPHRHPCHMTNNGTANEGGAQ